ncbi:hypothetical protein CT0861_13266 [Colletotrichum tofieldiae]|uniref:Uncharacterized protein n=1 Tax=Colletotrichum tofieldiae TaxID=708197 RepID=A0A166YR59_9PEZI|nr:hypothetical protein CT0861_13266 [Colletotrichum tofieldiae]
MPELGKWRDFDQRERQLGGKSEHDRAKAVPNRGDPMGDQEAAPPSPVPRITAFGFDLGLSTATFAAAAGDLGLVGFGDVAAAKRR